MRRPVTTVAVLLAGALALVGPAVAERSALLTLRKELGRCPGQAEAGDAGLGWLEGVISEMAGQDDAGEPVIGSACGGLARADVDVGGLRLWHPWREHGGLRVEADEVSVTADGTGVLVDARAPRLGPAVSTEASERGGRSSGPKSDAPASEPRTRRSPLHTRGVPVHVRAHGAATWSHDGVEVTVDEPALDLDGHGGATVSFGLALAARGLRAEGVDRWTAHAVDGDPRRWEASGAIELAGGMAADATLAVSREVVHATLHDSEGGRLALTAPLPRGGRVPEAIRVRAEQFALATLGQLGQRTLLAFGLRTEGARVDGSLELTGLPDAGRALQAQIDRLVIDGLVVDHRKLARDAVELDALELHGELSLHEDGGAGQLWLSHRDARLAVTAQIGPESFDLRTELAPLPCQALLDAFPVAMSEMVSGTRLRGELSARAEVHIDRATLALARVQAEAERGRRRDREASGEDERSPRLAVGTAGRRVRSESEEEPIVPGRLEFAFPFLEQCEVVSDDPRLDLEALSGPYRHRFVDDDGRVRERMMAPGAPGYVSLHEVSLVARAFVTLEDRRFWDHDGFDREQIAGAFWYNLAQGRVSRGASTISQQAARNLWLGVDRSWGRKLQEALLTARLEASTQKQRILELYLNVIELGPGTHGVDEAALLYFGKPASKLSVLQAIHLAAMAPAPRRLAERFVDGQVDTQWLVMLREHVRRMHRAGHIDEGRMYEALRADLGLLDRR